MKPIGLSLKKDGELMVVHLCLNCGKISPNRIAGDDNSYSIERLINEVAKPETHLAKRLRCSGVKLISQNEKSLALTAIFGYEYEKYLFGAISKSD